MFPGYLIVSLEILDIMGNFLGSATYFLLEKVRGEETVLFFLYSVNWDQSKKKKKRK